LVEVLFSVALRVRTDGYEAKPAHRDQPPQFSDADPEVIGGFPRREQSLHLMPS